MLISFCLHHAATAGFERQQADLLTCITDVQGFMDFNTIFWWFTTEGIVYHAVNYSMREWEVGQQRLPNKEDKSAYVVVRYSR